MSEAKELMYKLVAEAKAEVELYQSILKKSILTFEALKAQADMLGCELEEGEDASE